MAGVVYAAMHALVLGHAVLRQAAKSTRSLGVGAAAPDQQATPALHAFTESEGRLTGIALAEMIDLLIASIEHETADVSAR
jgi:hypothetical protein